jgi:transcriptional regulator with XRE-family HTH domain
MGQRLRSMYRNLGMQRPDAAKFLQVSERTLHNWESGRHVIPFAVYKLLRLLNRMDLPGPDWDGWYFQANKLCSPEGRSFAATDASWLSLLVRRAGMFGRLYADNVRLRSMAMGAERPDRETSASGLSGTAREAACPEPTAGAARSAGLDLSIRHFGTHPQNLCDEQGEQP